MAFVRAFFSRVFRRRRPYPILRPYVNPRQPLRRVGRIIFPILLVLFCLVYGFFFALTAPYLLVPFTAPIVILVLLAIWALPDTPHAPLRAVEWLFASTLISRVLWPNYLALQLPGLPWITALRLFSFPMGFLLLISLSTSPQFRREAYESIRSARGLLTCLVGLTVMQFITLPFSKDLSASMQYAMLDLIYMGGMIVVGGWAARTPGRATRYVNLMMLLAIPIIVITVVEVRVQNVLWNGHVPAFLKVNDPAAVRALSAVTRNGADGVYRAKATFTTALGLAEYLAILTPFFIHYAAFGRNLFIRAANILALPLSFYCIIATDARLGVVGFLISLLAYLLYWGIGRFARNRQDLIGASVVYGYPAFFVLVLAAVLSVHRLRVMVLGGGEAASSNEARASQIAEGVPHVFSNPIGHGLGQAANYLGYGADDFITIDNYFLSVALETGPIGLIAFIGIFASVILAFIRLSIRNPKFSEDPELALLLPISVSFSAFLVIKLVFSQTDSHMLLFAMVGLGSGLLYRASQLAVSTASSAGREAAAAHARARRTHGQPVAAKGLASAELEPRRRKPGRPLNAG